MHIYLGARYIERAAIVHDYSRIHDRWFPVWEGWTESRIESQFRMDHGYNKARVADRYRVVGRFFDVGDQRVFALLDVFFRPSREYNDFRQDADAYGAKYLDGSAPLADIERWLSERLQDQERHRNQPPPPPPEDLLAWPEFVNDFETPARIN